MLDSSDENDRTLRERLVRRIWRNRDPFRSFPKGVFEVDTQGWGEAHPYLPETIEMARPSVVVEVGVWKGASTIVMARKLKELGLDSVVLAVDTWLGAWDHWISDEWFEHLGMDHGYPMIARKFTNNVIAAGLDEHVLPMPLDSHNASRVLRHFGVKPQVIHLDGAHDRQAVAADLEAWWPLLEAGGYLIGDDYHPHTHWPRVKQAFDEFAEIWNLGPIEHVGGKCRLAK